MKKSFTLAITFFLCFGAFNKSIYAQTKILDTKVDWTSGNLILYLSDSLATSVTVQLGTVFQAHDVFNGAQLVLGTDLPHSDMLVIPLSNVSLGIYYVDVKVTTLNGIQEMEFQTSN